MSLFIRNHPGVIKNALTLTQDEFLLRYKGVTTEEVLTKAYQEIRKKDGTKTPVPVIEKSPSGASVTFKVLQINKPVPKPVMKVVRDRELTHDEQMEEDMLVAQREVDYRKPRTTIVGDRRDAKIKKLLEKEKTTDQIIDIFSADGKKVYPAQISHVRKSLNTSDMNNDSPKTPGTV